MDTSVSGVGVLDKSISILVALESAPLGLAELVEVTGLARPTCHRLASALEDHGLVRRDGDGRWALGVRLAAFGRAALAGFPLGERARPALERLRAETGESSQLYVVEGDRRVCVATVESAHGLRTIVPVGAALTMDAGSAARALRGDVRSGGWAESVAEREAGVASVSAPVRDADGAVIAAVSVSGPIERLTRRPGSRYGDAVVAAARAIESATSSS